LVSTDMIIYSSPFSQKKQHWNVIPGATISESIETAGLSNANLSIYCEDDLIPRAKWGSFKIRQNKIITVFVFPSGGGDGKNPMRTILMVATLALAVAAPYMAPAAWNMGAGTIGGGFLSAGVGIAGSLAVNAICPPPAIDAGGFASNMGIQNSFSITGTKNRSAPFGTVPKIYGTHRIFPPLSSKPYTELIGNDQYIRMLFCLGLGDLDLSEHKIGETAIADFDDCEIVVGTTENLPSIYETNVQQDDYNNLLPSWEYQTGSGGWPTHVDTEWTVITAAVNASEIIFDLTAPQGLFYLDRYVPNNKHALGITLAAQKSVSGSGVWESIPEFQEVIPVWPWTTNRIGMVGEDGTALRQSFRLSVDPDEQWEIRIRRIWLSIAGGDSVWAQDPCHEDHSDYLYNDLYWSSMRSVIVTSDSDAPVKAPNMNLVALRIKATEQLSGIVDTYNCVASAKLKTYDGSAWTAPLTTSSPAWAYVDVLTGDANKRPLANSRLDADAFKTWADWCTANSFEFNGVLNSKSTVFEVLRKIAPTGRGAYAVVDGQYSIVHDIPQTFCVQHFTPRNSWGYKGSKVFSDEIHAFKMPFLNREESWLPDEMVVYADGYTDANASKFEKLEVPGITDADHLWKTGRYYIANAQLRPEKHILYVDVENLRCTRGDLVKVSHDVPCWGLGWGRVKTIHLSGDDVDEVTTDETFTFETGKTYVARFRTLNNESVLANLVNPGTGEYTTLSFSAPVTGVDVGDLIMFGETDEESVDHIIYSIEPLNDLTARLTLIDAAPGVHTADSGTIPAFDPHITQPVDITLLPPAKPVIDSIISDQAVIISSGNGALVTQMVINFTVDSFTSTVIAYYRLVVDLVDEDDVPLSANRAWRITPPCEASQGNIQIINVDGDCEYEVLIFAFSPYDIRSEASDIVTHTIEGKNNPPQPVTGFAASILSEVVRLSWDASIDTDLSYYEVRYGADWDTGIFISQTLSIELDIEPAWTDSRTFWLKAVDTSGNESLTAATCSLSITQGVVSNLIAMVTGDIVSLAWIITEGELPVAVTELRRGDVFEDADVVGTMKGTTSMAIQSDVGLHTYWAVTIDSAGVYGIQDSVLVDVVGDSSFLPISEVAQPISGARIFVMQDQGLDHLYVKFADGRTVNLSSRTVYNISYFIDTLTVPEPTIACDDTYTAGNVYSSNEALTVPAPTIAQSENYTAGNAYSRDEDLTVPVPTVTCEAELL